MQRRWRGWVVMLVMAVTVWAPDSAAQAPPPGAVTDVISPSLAPCTTGMRVVGFDHGPDGRPVVAWSEDCGSNFTTTAFWTRGAVGGGAWTPRPYQSEHVFDHDHRLFVMPGDGAPMMLFSSIGNFQEINTYRIDLDTTLVPGSTSTYLENVDVPQSCVRPAYAAASGPTGTATAGMQWATATTSCGGFGRVRVNGTNLMSADAGGPKASLAVTPGGTTHVLWRTDLGLFHARRPAGAAAWTMTTWPGAAREVALVADAGGGLHALVTGWAQDHAGDLGTMVYFRSADDGLTWSAPEFVDAWDTVPANPGIHTDIALAVDATGVPAVAYWKGRRQLWYAKRDGPGPSWNRAQAGTHTTDAPRQVGLDFDRRNQPVLVYFDQPNNRLVAARTLAPPPAATTTTLTASATSITVGQRVHLSATVAADPAAGTPDGAVYFTDPTTGGPATRVPLVEGSAPWTIDRLPIGTHTLRASYEGNEAFASSAGTVIVTVTPEVAPPEIRPLPDRLDLVLSENVLIPIEISGAASVTVDGLPRGAVYLEDEDRRIEAPVLLGLGVFHVTVTATNAAGSASTSFTWTVRDNSAPYIPDPGPQSSLAGRPVELRLATLDGDGDALTITNAALPPGITATLDRTVLVFSGAVSQLTTFNVSIRVFDGFASFDRHFTWTFLPWTDLQVASSLTLAPAFAGDPTTRATLGITARELAGVGPRFTPPEDLVFDIDLPPGAVFTGFEAPLREDGRMPRGSCRTRPGGLVCRQPVHGVGGAVYLDEWIRVHLLLPVRIGPLAARTTVSVPRGLDIDATNNTADASALGVVRAATGQRAIVIVMENNDTQSTSTSYGGLRDAVDEALTGLDLVAAGVPPEVVAAAAAVGGPVYDAANAALAAGIGTLNQSITNWLLSHRGNTGGCYTRMLTTLANDPRWNRRHPLLGFIDQNGETAIAECLRELATPYYDRVEVLTDADATFANFKAVVERLHAEGFTMDLLLDVHGCGVPQTRNNVNCGQDPSLRFADGSAFRDALVTNGGWPLGDTLPSINSFFNGTAGDTDAQGRFVATAETGYVRLDHVYMVACWGSNFNDMWLDMGARASNGTEELNYFVLSSPFTFLDQFTRGGASLDQAAQQAYDEERVLFEGLPVGVTFDFRDLAGCVTCVYSVDLAAVYRRRLALALGRIYGQDRDQAVEPVPSSRRVGAQRQPVEVGTNEIVLGGSAGQPLLRIRPTTVTSGGSATLTAMSVGPSLGVHASLGTSDLQYDIRVSAVLEGPTEVCLTWNEGRFLNEDGVRLQHYSGGAWHDQTTSLDTSANVVCATVTSFSPFAMTEFVNRAPVAVAGPDQQLEATGPAGATVTFDATRSIDPDDDPLTFHWAWAGGSADGPTPTNTWPIGRHDVTLTVTDAFGAVSQTTLTVSVVPPTLTGRMLGEGHLDSTTTRATFAFRITKKDDGTVGGDLTVKQRPHATRRRTTAESDRFIADAVSSLAFFADEVSPEPRRRRPVAATFSGHGRWNGLPGYRFDARATTGDGRLRDRGTFAITITGPDGAVVAAVSGNVDDGRIVAAGDPPRSR